MAKATMEAAAIVRVRIPSPLRSYTDGASEVTVALPVLAPEHPPALNAVLAALEAKHRGLRFRIIDEQDRMRAHMRFFINGEQVFDLSRTLRPTDEIQIVQALSGG